MKTTKRTLFTSIIALTLCLAMLVGSTFAWFTDIVSSNANIIQSGKLDAEMYWSDTLLDASDADWQNANGVPIFTYSKWEPGYTEIRYIKVVNAGNLSFNWSISIEPEGEVGKLAEVIDVYYVNPVTSTLTTLEGQQSAGVLKDVLANHVTTSGVLLPEGETSAEYTSGCAILAIAFHMQEEAGNDYQEKDIGDGFSLKLMATQFSYEEDAFGSEYDSNVTLPDPIPDSQGTVTVTPDADGKVPTGGAVIDAGNGITANVPEGVQMEDGANSLTLSVNNIIESNANLLMGESEVLRSLDVHIEGVSRSNTVPMEITIEGAVAKGLNSSSLSLYHVENGATVQMTLIGQNESFTAHNQFKYDPATGNITLNMASFSEVVTKTNVTNLWEGGLDYSWYDASKSELYIANADQLAAFGAIVGGMKKVTGIVDGKYTYSDEVIQDSFEGKTVKLLCDIYIGDTNENYPDASENGIVFYPIGYCNNEGTYERLPANERVNAVESGFCTFMGTFDGDGHTISDWYQNTWEMKGDHNWYNPVTEQYYRDGMGLFGRVYKGTVKNLVIKNFSSDGEITTTGTVAAYADGATFENISIFNCNPRVYNIGNGGIVGCVGWYAKEANLKTTFTNITVDNSNKISALWGSYDVPCGGIVGQYYPVSGQTSAGTPENGGIHFENCHVGAQIDVFNDVCGNYQYYAYRYAGILMGSVRDNEIDENGHEVPKMDGITAENCTVHFGDWNDYYYCELASNGKASYTHDNKMSRLEQVASVNGKVVTYLDGTTETITGTRNFVVVKAKDDAGNWIHGDGSEYATCYHFKNGEVWTHDMAGIQTGVDENGDEQDDLVEDKQLIYREFNNLVTGYGWGVTSKGIGDMEGVSLLDNTKDSPDSVEKFVPNANITTEENNFSIHLGELFAAAANIDSKFAIKPESIQVTITNVDEDGNYDANGKVIANFVRNISDWTNSTITLTGTGRIKITIQDYFYCVPASIIIDVIDAKMDFFVAGQDLVDKARAEGTTQQSDARLSQGVNRSETKLENGYAHIVSSDFGDKTALETYFYILNDNNLSAKPVETGKYFVMKYRVPTLKDPNYSFNSLEVFTSTKDYKALNDSSSGGATNDFVYSSTKTDGEWRIVIYDLSANTETFNANFEAVHGRYYSNFARIDILNNVPAGQSMDIEFMGMANSLDEIRNTIISHQESNKQLYGDSYAMITDMSLYITSSPQYLPLYTNYSIAEDSAKYIPQAQIANGIEYVSCIDWVNSYNTDNDGVNVSAYTISSTQITEINFNRPVATKLYLNGWVVMSGGIKDYYWSVDGGSTWHIINHTHSNSNTDMLSTANGQHVGNYTFVNDDLTNGAFQNHRLVIDFTGTAYSGEKDIIIAAEPKTAEGKYCIISVVNNVEIKGAGYENYTDIDRFIHPDSVYVRSDKNYVANIDYVQSELYQVSGNSATSIGRVAYRNSFGQHVYSGSMKSASSVMINGWAMVKSGVEKYVWSYDGKTWYDAKAITTPASDSIISSANNTFSFDATDAQNGSFQIDQGRYLLIDFTELIKEYPYLQNHQASITIAAVPTNDANLNDGKTELCILYRLNGFRICKSTAAESTCDGDNHAYSAPKYVVKDGFAVIETACQCGNATTTRIPYRVMHTDYLYTNSATNNGQTSFAGVGTQRFGNNQPESYDLKALKYSTTNLGRFRCDGWIGLEDRVAGVKYRVLDSNGNELQDWTECGKLSARSDLTATLNKFNIMNSYEGCGFTSDWIDLSKWIGTTTARGAYTDLTVEFAFISVGALQDGLTGNDALVYLGAFKNVNLGCTNDHHTMLDTAYTYDANGYIKTITEDCICGANKQTTQADSLKYVLHFDYLGNGQISSNNTRFSNTEIVYTAYTEHDARSYTTATGATNSFTTSETGKLYIYGWAGIDNGLSALMYRVVYKDSTGEKKSDWNSISVSAGGDSVNSAISTTYGITTSGYRYNATNIDLSSYLNNGYNADGVTIEFAFVYTPAFEDLQNNTDSLIYVGTFTNVKLPAAQ